MDANAFRIVSEKELGNGLKEAVYVPVRSASLDFRPHHSTDSKDSSSIGT